MNTHWIYERKQELVLQWLTYSRRGGYCASTEPFGSDHPSAPGNDSRPARATNARRRCAVWNLVCLGTANQQSQTTNHGSRITHHASRFRSSSSTLTEH